MTVVQNTLGEDVEAIMDALTETLLLAVQDVEDEYGERPIGAVEGDIYEQLEEYLDFRDDEAACRLRIQMTAVEKGKRYANIFWLNESTRLERALRKRGGEEAVAHIMLERRLRRGKAALDEVDRILAMPKIEVLPPARKIDTGELMDEMLGLGEKGTPSSWASKLTLLQELAEQYTPAGTPTTTSLSADGSSPSLIGPGSTAGLPFASTLSSSTSSSGTTSSPSTTSTGENLMMAGSM